MLALLALCSIFVPQFVGGVRLPGCSSNRLQVDERNSITITCDQIGTQDTVLWYIDRNGKEEALGSCPPVGSNCIPQREFDLSRTSTQSTVTSQPLSYIREFKKIRCDIQGQSSNRAECALDVVYPAVMLSTSCKVEAKSETWRVEGSCDITKTFSSMGYYKCQVYKGTNQSPTDLFKNGSYNTSPHSDNKYHTGSCSFSEHISNLLTQGMTTQNFFNFTVYPGPTHVVKGPVIIERPATPTITCPDIIGENVNFTCTCTTTKIGQPAGRLYWSLKNVVQTEGNYGDTTLTTRTLTLNRGDNGQTNITCGLRWAVYVASDVYTANVGFPPSRTTLQINAKATTTTSVTVNENSPVSFTCTTIVGNPTSSLTLSDIQSTISSSKNSTMTYSLGPGQCEHNGPYTCTASNGYGDGVTATSTLYVLCAPRGDKDIDAVNFINDSVSASFDVTAYPAPNRVTFNFLGKNGTATPADIDSNSITMNGSCVQTTTVFKSTCTVTVSSVKREAAAGFYQVNVHNNINTGTGSFKLQVKFREPVIDKQTGGDEGTPVAAIVGGVVAAIVVIILIAVIVLFVMKRRKGPGKERLESTESTADHINGNEMSAVAHQQLPTGALTFSPQDEYAVVNKPKKPAGAAAPATVATTDSEQPNDTYAVVDKKAKKKAEPGVKDGTKVKKKADPGVKDGAKAKPTKKEKKAMDEGAHVYGNVEDTKPLKKKKKSPPAPKEEARNTKPNVNQDGLLYSDVVFTKSPTEHPTPVPVEEGVVYSAVDFTQTAPPM